MRIEVSSLKSVEILEMPKEVEIILHEKGKAWSLILMDLDSYKALEAAIVERYLEKKGGGRNENKAD